jgi:hypothetical protein
MMSKAKILQNTASYHDELIESLKKSRINIILEKSTALAKELALEALERHEDMALSTIAKLRDVLKAKRLKHCKII